MAIMWSINMVRYDAKICNMCYKRCSVYTIKLTQQPSGTAMQNLTNKNVITITITLLVDAIEQNLRMLMNDTAPSCSFNRVCSLLIIACINIKGHTLHFDLSKHERSCCCMYVAVGLTLSCSQSCDVMIVKTFVQCRIKQ